MPRSSSTARSWLINAVRSPTNRERVKLIFSMVLAGVFAVGVFAAAQSTPKVAEILEERAGDVRAADLEPFRSVESR